MAHVVVASYRSKPGREADVAEHLRATIAPARAEPGCEAYRVVRAKNDAASFVQLESYADEESFETHKDSRHFEGHIRNGARNLIDSREVVIGDDVQD